jgi:hypothetical protein
MPHRDGCEGLEGEAFREKALTNEYQGSILESYDNCRVLAQISQTKQQPIIF